MSIAIGVMGVLCCALFVIGFFLMVPGIVGTAVTSKIKHGPKAPRVLSLIAMIMGIVLCALAILLFIFIVIMR